MNPLTNFPYKKILVLGLAKSGTAAAKLLLTNGYDVRVNDMHVKENDENVAILKEMGGEIIVGSHPLSVLDNIDVIIKNPGIPYENIVVEEGQRRGIPIITEVELAYKLVKGPIIGITGSNGKTTTTTLITEMLNESNQQAKIAGNIGSVATEIAQIMENEEKMVLELSSFQLLGIEAFRPKVAVLLNIYEAHLDYHKTLDNYIEAKFNIFKNQTADDYLVFNKDDQTIAQHVHKSKASLIPFSLKEKLLNGGWTDGISVYFKDEKIIDMDKIILVGHHNLENILAAVCVAKICGASNNSIKQVLTTFSGVRHRLEFVRELNGRLFYNDSKATNILATQKALAAFNQSIILLAGGLDRGNEFHELIPYFKNVKAMILFGQTANKLEQIAKKANISSVFINNDMEEAVHLAYEISDCDDIILLSPACASWDQYCTFEERGDMFSKAVHTL